MWVVPSEANETVSMAAYLHLLAEIDQVAARTSKD